MRISQLQLSKQSPTNSSAYLKLTKGLMVVLNLKEGDLFQPKVENGKVILEKLG